MRSFPSRFLVLGVAVSTFAATAVLATATATPALAAPDFSQTFAATGAAQTWTVPLGVTEIYVDIAGAPGGASYGGGGAAAELTGVLSVTPGDVLNIVVGGRGANGSRYNYGGGGGGGSFIYTTADQSGILAAAGGGGGAGSNFFPTGASLTTTGNPGTNSGGAGGTAGSGGSEGANTGGGGGGGLLTNGASSYGGKSVNNGSAGGFGAGFGGFGGGGGSNGSSGGGGGGYSGGGGGNFAGGNAGGGGGGGSYFSGTLTGAQANYGGDGFVTIYYPSKLTSISPTFGFDGDVVTISGVGLAGATATVSGVAATVTSTSDTQVVLTVPAQSPQPVGPQRVEITTTGGITLPIVGAFTYSTMPVLTAVSPSSVDRGSSPTITLSGKNFTGATAVYFGATPATSFTVESNTSITAVVPASLMPGTLNTTVVNPTGTTAVTAAGELRVLPYPAMSVGPSTLTKAQIGVAYAGQITANGGTAPYTYSLVSGALPDGIVLDETTGALEGTPTALGSSSFTILATDQYGNTESSIHFLDVETASSALAVTGFDVTSGLALGGGVLVVGIALLTWLFVRRRNDLGLWYEL